MKKIGPRGRGGIPWCPFGCANAHFHQLTDPLSNAILWWFMRIEFKVLMQEIGLYRAYVTTSHTFILNMTFNWKWYEMVSKFDIIPKLAMVVLNVHCEPLNSS